MLYSCFNQAAALYDYFEDGLAIPVNGDLPIPSLPPIAGKIGVPALQAGRPLPVGAKHVGQGFAARGIIVECGQSGSLGDASMGTLPPAWKWAVALAAVVGVLYVAQTKPVRDFVGG